MAQSQGLSPITILSRDIDFYHGMAEIHKKHMRECAPSQMQYHWSRMVAAVFVQQALIQYKETLEGEENGGR